jgi:hypothetical protein
MSRRRRNAIAGQFAARPIKMLESPAYRALSRAAHQVLARIEVEHAHHGGADNGELPVTYDHFVEYGLHRHAIAPAIRELVALGFIQITARGCAGNEHYRRPNLFRLTYRPTKDATAGDGTHEWQSIKTVEQAEARAQQARQEADPRARALSRARARKKIPGDGFRQVSVTVSDTDDGQSPVTETVTTCVSAETVTTSISREDRAVLAVGERRLRDGPHGFALSPGEPASHPSEPASHPSAPAGPDPDLLAPQRTLPDARCAAGTSNVLPPLAEVVPLHGPVTYVPCAAAMPSVSDHHDKRACA